MANSTAGAGFKGGGHATDGLPIRTESRTLQELTVCLVPSQGLSVQDLLSTYTTHRCEKASNPGRNDRPNSGPLKKKDGDFSSLVLDCHQMV